MTMKSFCFMLQINTISPALFFDKIEENQMVELKRLIDAAKTPDDAQKIINKYV